MPVRLRHRISALLLASLCAAAGASLSLITGCSQGPLKADAPAVAESQDKAKSVAVLTAPTDAKAPDLAFRNPARSHAAAGEARTESANVAVNAAAQPQLKGSSEGAFGRADAAVGNRISGSVDGGSGGTRGGGSGRIAGQAGGFGAAGAGILTMPMGAAGTARAKALPAVAAAPPIMMQQRTNATLNPNMYVASNYIGGSGERERIEKLISEGVLVDGKRVKLEAFSHEYHQSFAIPTDRSLAVSADTERTKIFTEGDKTYLQVGLQAMKGEAPKRPPLNVALVIDHSGSMGNENKMEDAKTAARELVDRLRPDDTVSIVTFDDTATVLVPATRAANRAGLKAKIATIRPGGGTNIYDGLKLGFAEAARNARREGVVSLTILLSDGEVTSGIRDPEAFRKLVSENVDKNDIQTTTVGVGVEYNEDLMLSLAREGKGNYHFLKTGADARTVFAQEMDDLSQIVAKAVKVRVVLGQGVGLVRVLGTRALSADETKRVKADERTIDRKVYEELGIATNRQHEPEEPGIKMLIPNFHRGDSHVILMEVTVPQGAGVRKVADVYLKYKDLAKPANRQETASAQIEYTPDRAVATTSVNRSVKKNVLGFQTGEALMAAAERIAQGQYADAVRLIDERMVVLGIAAKTWADTDLDRDGKLLAGYKTVLAQAAQNPSAGYGLGGYLQKSLTYNAYQRTR